MSATVECSEQHWLEVRSLLAAAIDGAGLNPRLVSEANDVGVIHKRIIGNLYDLPLVICDVSGTNPNVMFELGMRLAFDKPAIIIKDDKTTYSFDTAPIEHLTYPRDLRFNRIVDFQKLLQAKIAGTIAAATSPSYTSFLQSFGTFAVAQIPTAVANRDDLVLEELQDLRKMIHRSNPASGRDDWLSFFERRNPPSYIKIRGELQDVFSFTDQLEHLHSVTRSLVVIIGKDSAMVVIEHSKRLQRSEIKPIADACHLNVVSWTGIDDSSASGSSNPAAQND